MTTSSIINEQYHSHDTSPLLDDPLIHHKSKSMPGPGPLETAVLKLHFQKNRFPSEQEKERIVKKLHDSFGTEMAVQQLGDWYENERSSSSKSSEGQILKKAYRKFEEEHVKLLQASFEKNNYPSVEEMKAMAEGFGVDLIKIENWYKHHRRSLAKRGQFDIKSSELNYLMGVFHKQNKPTHEQIQIIAQNMDCTPYQIKNWFSNKRKKLKSITKNQTPSTEPQTLASGSLNPSPIFSSSLPDPSQTSFLSLNSPSNDHRPMTNAHFPRACFASFSPSLNHPSQDFIQEISRLQNLQQAGNYPSDFLNSFRLPLCSPNILNSQLFTYSSPSKEVPSKTLGKSHIELLQSGAIKALNDALNNSALQNMARFTHHPNRGFPE